MKNLITTVMFFLIASFAIAQGSLDSALVAYYPFNGNASDESGNANNPTFIGSGVTLTTDRFGNPNKAFYFDGNTDSYIRIPADNFPTTDRTISFWFNADQMENHPTPLSYGGDVCNNSVLMTFNKGGYPNAYTVLSHCGSNFISAPYSISPINNWYHFTMTIVGATQKIYINGELQETANTFSTTTFVADKSAIIGALLFNDGNTVYVDPTAGYFQGKLDDFRFYNSAMTDLEVQNLYNIEVDGLVAYLPFNGNANDVSGNGHDGILYGNTSLVSDRFNFPDRAYTFPDQTSNISLTNSINLNLETGFTINAWIIYKGGRQRLIVDKHICGTPNGFAFHIDWDGQIAIYLANSGWSIVKTNDTFIEDNWYMVTASYDAGTGIAKVYVDGELGGSGSVTYNNFSTYPISIGETYQNNCIPGNMDSAIDEVKIYNRSLSDAEILEEYNSSNTDLIAYYPFNENVNDESGNNINPTYVGTGVTLTSDRFGLNNRACYFDGNDGSYIRVPADSFPTTGRTISLWVNVMDLPSYQGKVPFSYGGNGCNTSSFLTAINNAGNSSFWSAGHCGESAISYVYTTSPLNTWKHWVITIEGSTQRLYIDGELKETTDNYIGPAYVEGKSGLIGALINVDGIGVYVDPSAGYFKGKIDDIRIYNHAITDQEVVLLFNDSTTYTPPNLQDGLSLFLPFNGNAYDESGNNNSGVVTGANTTQDRFGTDGRAYNFDGVDDFITIADNPNLFSDEMTISWWYKLSEVPGAAWVVIGWVEGGHRYQQFFSGAQLSYLNGYNVAQPGTYFNPIYSLNDLNVWKNVVVTYQKTSTSTSTTSIYVDGELQQIDNHTLAMDYVPGINFSIGKNHNGNFFKGSLDDFRIYNRILDSTEIVALYNDSTTYYPPIAEDSLVSYYAFNSTSNDSSGNGNHGINYNGVYNKDRYGFDNSSMYFNGVDSYVEGINPGNNLPTGNSPRTFSAWIKNYEYNQWGSNIFHYGTAQAAPTNFHFLITNVLGLGNGYGYSVVYGNTNLNDSVWHFVAGVYEGGTERITKLYVDGKLDSTGVLNTEPNTVLGNNWKIGQFMASGTPFKGNIDELKIFNMALSDQKILEIYKIGTTAPDLILPENNSTINTLTPGFYWDSSIVASSYQIIISTDSNFTSIVLDETVIRMYYIISGGLLNTDINYYWKVRTINDGGIGPWSDVFKFKIVITDVENEQQLPTEFILNQNYPNPFNPSTIISYELPNASKVIIKVYDIIGNEVATLVNEEKPAGRYNIEFSGSNLSSGIYLYKIIAGDFIQTQKMILVK
ncbi:MAG: T9SS type A sorting domain-containing protein [Bacteroidia bacterium]|nr:T9SS type A sorting domain-containing protein [Bacteroidia bacterium]